MHKSVTCEPGRRLFVSAFRQRPSRVRFTRPESGPAVEEPRYLAGGLRDARAGVTMSPIGTKRTSGDVRLESAFGTKAENICS